MSTQVHTRSSFVAVAAALIAVALPVTVLFSREEHASFSSSSPTSVEQAEVALSVPAYSIAPGAGLPSSIVDVTDWTGDVSQSASMVLVGGLLIGLGSIVRRSA